MSYMQQNSDNSIVPRTNASQRFTTLSKYKVFVGIVGLFLALAAWAVASPVGSSPDDDFHLASIWCGDGIRNGLCEPGSSENSRMVPLALAHSICYAYNPESNATCQDNNLAINPELLYETERLNTTGLYPPLFYATLGLLASDHLQVSVVMMRLVNAAIFTILFSLTFIVVSRKFRSPLLLTYACTLVPLGFFLIPSTNPSSWAVISIGMFFFLLASLAQEVSSKRAIATVVLSVICFTMLVGSRGDGAIFAAIAVLSSLVLYPPLRKFRIPTLGLFVFFFTAAVFIFLSTGQASVTTEGLSDQTASATKHSGFNLLLFNILNMPSLITGVFGSWGLGWLDTVMPPMVWGIGLIISCIVIFQGMTTTNKRKNLVSLAVLALLFAIPLYVLQKSNAAVGAYVQPRYIYPLVILLVAISLVPLTKSTAFSINFAQKIIIFFGLALAFSISLHLNMDRYISGISNPSWDLQTADGWWWNVPISAFSVWLVGSICSLFFFWVAASEFQRNVPQSDKVHKRKITQTGENLEASQQQA